MKIWRSSGKPLILRLKRLVEETKALVQLLSG